MHRFSTRLALAIFLVSMFISTLSRASEEFSKLGGQCVESEEAYSCGEGAAAIHIIRNTLSPAKPISLYAVGWRAPDREDWPYAEVYLMRLSDGSVLHTLNAKIEWANKTQLANHQSVFASWMGNEGPTSGGFMLVVNSKWETNNVQIYQSAHEDALTFKGDVMPIIGEALYSKLYEDNPDVDLDGYVLSIDQAPRIGPTEHKQSTTDNTAIVTGVFQEPKASTPIFEYETEVKLDSYKAWSQTVVTSIRPLETN